MKKRFLAIFIVVMMLFSQITVFASVPDSSTTSINPEDKLTDELKEVMSNTADDEYISISVWLHEIDDSYVYNTISEHYGIEINQNNENAFLQKQVNDKTAKFYSITNRNEMSMQASEMSIQSREQITKEFNAIRNNSIVNDTISDNNLREFMQSGKDISELIARSEQNAYMKEWRNARKNINTTINSSFENSLDLDKCKDIYIDSLIGYATLETKNSYILTIASSPLVKQIGLFNVENAILVDSDDESTTDNTQNHIGYHMNQDNIPTQYTGFGVNIGVIELGESRASQYRVKYDTNNVHLANKNGKIYTNYTFGLTESQVSAVPKEHATYVLTMLCGEPVTSTTGEIYQGIAPNATVYYAGVKPNYTHVYSALDWLINESNVSIINLSFTDANSTDYSDVDQYIDCLIQQYRVTFTIAAGNDGDYVKSVAKAYNAITVGNETSEKNSDNQYIIRSSSNFNESDGYANKPDIVAHGTNLYTLNTNLEPTCALPSNPANKTVTGTSFASPIVAGTIALMIQRNPCLENKPDKIKAILLNSANEEEINTSDSDDYQRCATPINSSLYIEVDGVMRNKTGAGILNIRASVENATGAITMSYTLNSASTITTSEYFIPADTEFKIGIVFEKTDHDKPTEDSPHGTIVNFEMIDINTGTVVLSSVYDEPKETEQAEDENSNLSVYDNVKIFNVTTQKSGTYVFRISATSFDQTDASGTTTPSVHENTHSKLNITLAITCSCLNPYTYSYDINYTSDSTAEMHSCNNTGCFYTNICEIEYHQTLVKNEDFGTVTHTVSHKRSYSGGATIVDETINVYVSLNDSTKTCRISRGGGDIFYNQYGYIEYYMYEVFIFNNDGSLYDILETDVYVQYDNVMARIFLLS